MTGISISGISLLSSFLISFSLMPIGIKAARKLGILDRPSTPLKSHEVPMPCLGGEVMFLAFLVSVILAHILGMRISSHVKGITIGSAMIVAAGLIDDIRPLGPIMKLTVQTLCAFVLIKFDVVMRVEIFPDPLNFILTIIWTVAITNAMNFLDIMDGLAAGVAAVASISFLLIALPTEQPHVNVLSAALIGAILGFLPYNFPKASTFMGDAGSMFLGFALAGTAVSASYTKINNIAMFAPILILGIPIYDMAFVTILRLIHGKSILRGSPDHFALRLKAFGLSPMGSVLIVYAMSALLGLCAFAVTRVKADTALLIYILVFVAAIVTSRVMAGVKVDR
jgi:UDP-GlcNAc:undecaprenyl-phosphate GlcNAc-1-phosphate transferase